MVIVFGFDNYWGLLLIYSSNCSLGYQYTQILAFSPDHVLMIHLFSCFLLSSPLFLFPPALSSSNQVTPNPPTSNPSSNLAATNFI